MGTDCMCSFSGCSAEFINSRFMPALKGVETLYLNFQMTQLLTCQIEAVIILSQSEKCLKNKSVNIREPFEYHGDEQG